MKKMLLEIAEKEIIETYGETASITNVLQYAFEEHIISGNAIRDYCVRHVYKKMKHETKQKDAHIIWEIEATMDVPYQTTYRILNPDK